MSLNVSISESRCFSFQESELKSIAEKLGTFQSRNRDAFRFKQNLGHLHNISDY